MVTSGDLGITSAVLETLNSEQKATLKAILNYRSEEIEFDSIKNLIETIGGVAKLDRNRKKWKIAISLDNQPMRVLICPANSIIAKEDFVQDLKYILENFGLEAEVLER